MASRNSLAGGVLLLVVVLGIVGGLAWFGLAGQSAGQSPLAGRTPQSTARYPVGTSRKLAPSPEQAAAAQRQRQEYEKAAAGGNAEAQFQLGMLAGQADDLRNRQQITRSWFLQAARQGHAQAQFELGRNYTERGGNTRNLPLAVKWLTRAAEQGITEAWITLGDLYAEGGPGLLQDLARARECHQKADEKGKREDWQALGQTYCHGWGGIVADWPRAYTYYLKAAQAGLSGSQYAVGQLCQYGIGTAVDLPRAISWYTEAARQGDPRAAKKLGWLYEHGIGVARDRQQALTWYRKSEEHGGHCERELKRLGDPEALKRPVPVPRPVPVTTDVVITLEAEKSEFELDELVVVTVHYRNMSEAPCSFYVSHSGGFRDCFSVKDEKGKELTNPYAEPSRIHGGSIRMSSVVIQPGQSLVLKKTLNQCVHFEKPGTYMVSTSQMIDRGNETPFEGPKDERKAESNPLTLKMRASDPAKRQREIDDLARAYRENKDFPAGMARPAESFGGRPDILRRLVFYHEPRLLPLFLDALEQAECGEFAETGLRVLPDRAAVLKALEERLDHPEKYHTLDLLRHYLSLAGLLDFDFDGEPGRLDDWKREEEFRRKVRDKALQLVRGDKRYRYSYLVPGLLGGSDDLFLIDYLIHCEPNRDLVRSCSHALQRVKLGREHIPFLESLLSVERDWAITDAAILQLVRLDRARYLPELKTHPDNFSPEIVKLLSEPGDE